MLTPRKSKFRKMQRGGAVGRVSLDAHTLNFGKFGLKSLESKLITARQIEAARRTMTRYIKRGGQVWIRIFPDKPMTSNPPEMGMGGGKGAVDHYVAKVRAGRILFEMDGVEKEVAREALRLAAYKLPVKTKIIEKE
jgi:large subunit ribosomal protein L16